MVDRGYRYSAPNCFSVQGVLKECITLYEEKV